MKNGNGSEEDVGGMIVWENASLSIARSASYFLFYFSFFDIVYLLYYASTILGLRFILVLIQPWFSYILEVPSDTNGRMTMKMGCLKSKMCFYVIFLIIPLELRKV